MKHQSQTLLEARLEWEHTQSGEKAEKKNYCPPAAWGHSFIKTVGVGGNDGWDSMLRMWSTLKSCRACHCVTDWYYTSESNTVVSIKLTHVKLALFSPNVNFIWLNLVHTLINLTYFEILVCHLSQLAFEWSHSLPQYLVSWIYWSSVQQVEWVWTQ